MKIKWFEYIGFIVNGLSILFYFILIFLLEYPPELDFLNIFGILFLIAGIVFMVLAIFALRNSKSGKVIRTGVFSVVRHPMYLGVTFMFISMICFLPHWFMLILVAVNSGILYWYMVTGEKQYLEEFGEDYKDYMESVPRANLIAGVARLLRRK